ncbi:MAG: long-chain-acyl-CoA synthetase [Rhizobiales bacterium]|nr:long-chain-acyl-CoA synthetase [Hyphomicrobiales bacterium]
MPNSATITRPGFTWRFARKIMSPIGRRGMAFSSKSRRSDKMSLGIFLQKNAVERPQGIAIKYEDQTITWSAFNARANQVAHYLKSRGVEPGDAVAVNLQNRPELLITAMGIAKLGAVASMINTSQTRDVLIHSLKLVTPKLIIAGEETIPNMETVSALLKAEYRDRLLYWADGTDTPPPADYLDMADVIRNQSTENLPQTLEITLGAPVYHIFTSGTTGMPKASIASHMKTTRAGHYIGAFVLQMSPDDTLYCPLPFYHSNALTLSFSSVLVGGSTIAIGRKFSASRFWDECRHYKATTFCYIGETLRYLLNQPPSKKDRDHTIKKIVGNGLRPDIWKSFKKRFGIRRVHEFYGSSEGNAAFVNLLNYDCTCGWAPGAGETWNIVAYDVDADEPIKDSQGRLIVLDEGETGLLITKITDANPYDGYSDPAASERLCLRDVFETGDAWINTGDLLKRLPCGHVQFVDRVGDTFRWTGENVATTEVEAAVIGWGPVEDAVVYGVALPGYDGRCGMLALTPVEGAKPDIDDLARHLRKTLPGYAVPRFLRLRGHADVTVTFKHQKSTLKAEGIDISKIDDPVYLLAPAEPAWLPLTPERLADIQSGKIRL